MIKTMSKKVLMPLPLIDVDPSEVAVPWKILTENNVQVVFSTPNGHPGQCDPRMITGEGLGPCAPLLKADQISRDNYKTVSQSKEFNHPIKWSEIQESDYDGLLIPGGHAKGMRPYLESEILQKIVVDFFKSNKPVGAICHGVLLVARSKGPDGKSVLFKRKTTTLLQTQELTAWNLTRLWLDDYYRTYDITTQAEVTSFLENSSQFIKGPLPLFRDSPKNLGPGFFVRDGNYISARWPGDAHSYGYEFLKMINGS